MTKPTFKAGDRVYWLRFDNDSLKVDVLKVRENPFVRTKYTYPLAAFFDDKEIAVEFNKEGFGIFSYSIPVVVPATQENFERLKAMFSDVPWQAPEVVEDQAVEELIAKVASQTQPHIPPIRAFMSWWRLKHDITMSELAQILGIRISELSAIECGRTHMPPHIWAVLIADFMNTYEERVALSKAILAQDELGLRKINHDQTI